MQAPTSAQWRTHPTLLARATLALMAGCATSPVGSALSPETRVTPLHDRMPINSGNAASVVQTCIPNINAQAAQNMVKNWTFASGSVSVLVQNTRGTSYLAYSGGQAICVPRSASGASIFAAEAFDHTMVPEGVSAQTKANWLMQIATVYARNGKTSVAYSLPDGRVRLVKYVAEDLVAFGRGFGAAGGAPPKHGRGTLVYSYEDLSAGAGVDADLRFSGEGLTLVIPKAYRGSFARGVVDAPN